MATSSWNSSRAPKPLEGPRRTCLSQPPGKAKPAGPQGSAGFRDSRAATHTPRVKLSALLPPSQIRVPLRATTKAAAIDELLAALPFESEKQRDAARSAVLEREKEISTGIGRGVAVPHGRTAAVDRHYCAFGVATSPVDFEAIDGAPCRIFFLCVSADRDAADHVRLLSQVARVLNDKITRKALEGATTRDEVLRVFLADEAREGL